MPAYPKLAGMLGAMDDSSAEESFQADVIPYLTEIWINDYASSAHGCDIVEVTPDTYAYLFDITSERLIAAWGISHGRHGGARNKSRMAGHPLSAGSQYHRGHAVPHTLGGGTDINLVAQRGSVNIGPFRHLERQAVATPGALYFTYWIYSGMNSQTPTEVEQGLLIPGRTQLIHRHPN